MPFSNLLNTVLYFGFIITVLYFYTYYWFTMLQKTKDGQKTKDDNFSIKKQKKNKTVLP